MALTVGPKLAISKKVISWLVLTADLVILSLLLPIIHFKKKKKKKD